MWQRSGRGALLLALLACLRPAFAGDAAIVREVLALDCRRVAATVVAQALAKAPAPRIILFQGSLAVTTMEPFADFLAAMGYPRERLRDPRDGSVSQGSFGGSRRWAATCARVASTPADTAGEVDPGGVGAAALRSWDWLHAASRSATSSPPAPRCRNRRDVDKLPPHVNDHIERPDAAGASAPRASAA